MVIKKPLSHMSLYPRQLVHGIPIDWLGILPYQLSNWLRMFFCLIKKHNSGLKFMFLFPVNSTLLGSTVGLSQQMTARITGGVVDKVLSILLTSKMSLVHAQFRAHILRIFRMNVKLGIRKCCYIQHSCTKYIWCPALNPSHRKK